MFKSILPPNSTQLEQQLEQALDPARQISPLIPHLLQLRTKRPFADYFAGEWGVAQFRPFFTNNETFFAATIPWLQMRGTAAAVKTALSWINVTAELDVEQFYLHIELHTPYYGAWQDFNRCVRQSIPLHLDYYRVFANYDLRHGRYDASHYDNSVYDADSGVLIDGVLVSYGSRDAVQTTFNIGIGVAMTAVTVVDSIRRWTGNWDGSPWITNFRMLETKL